MTSVKCCRLRSYRQPGTLYGWEWPLSEDEVLERLLALNLERAAAQGTVSDDEDDEVDEGEAA